MYVCITYIARLVQANKQLITNSHNTFNKLPSFSEQQDNEQ